MRPFLILRSPVDFTPVRSSRNLAAALYARAKAGADDQDRTGDLVLTKDALCQLSYIGLRASASAGRVGRGKLLARSRGAAANSTRAGAPARASEGWSGRRGSNPRPTAWKAVTLPLSYSRLRARRATRLLAASRWQAQPYSHRSATAASPIGEPTSPLHPAATFNRARAHRTQPAARSAAKKHGGCPPHQPSSGAPTSHHCARREEGWWGGEGSNLRSH